MVVVEAVWTLSVITELALITHKLHDSFSADLEFEGFFFFLI